MNAPQPRSTPMVRLTLDIPASVPLTALHALAWSQSCVLVRTADGVYRLQPDRRKERGFTLLELMVAVLIIGILATIAIPSYAHTLMRAAVQDAIEWSQPVAKLMEANAKAGLPVDDGFTPTSNPLRRVDAIEITGETIVITLRGGTVVLAPVGSLTDTVVGWSCTQGTLPENFRPAACRGA